MLLHVLVPLFENFLPSLLSLSTWQISLSLKPGSDTDCSKFFLWILLPWMYPLLPFLRYMCCVYSVGMLFACLCSSSLLRAGAVSLISVTHTSVMKWQASMTTGERGHGWYTKPTTEGSSDLCHQGERSRAYSWWSWLNIDDRIFAAILLL